MVKASRTHEEFMADQIRFEQTKYDNLKMAMDHEEEESSKMFVPSMSKGTQKLIKKKVDGGEVD